MTPNARYGRPATPVPGADAPERRIAVIRSSSAHLAWSALFLIVVSAAVGYFSDNLPAPLASWPSATVVVWVLAGLLVFLFVVLPWMSWRQRSWMITTRRVVQRSGLFSLTRRELAHGRGYTITHRRSFWQRLSRTGTLELDPGAGPGIVMRSIPYSGLVNEVLVDQIEVEQIIAHRDAQTGTGPTIRS